MKPYKGIVRISCGKKKGCVKNLRENVQPGCLDCPQAVTEILDLDEKVLFKYRSPKTRTGKRKKKQ